MKKIEIQLMDVTVDDFPKENCVHFICDSDIYTGWPLIEDGQYEKGEYPDGFLSKEEAKENWWEVVWEASEGSIECTNVRYWFNRLKVKNK